jgi:hypothetical protein
MQFIVDPKNNSITQLFQHEFLMNAVMCMAAAHLHYIDPKNEEYREAELEHSTNAITGFRATLTAGITHQNADALMGCSILLYNHAWASFERDDSSFGLNSLVILSRGPADILMQTFNTRSGCWDMLAVYSPKATINEWLKDSNLPAELEQAFENHFYSQKSRDVQSRHFETCMQECRRLIPVLSMLKLRQSGVDISPLLSDIIRYISSFPWRFGDCFLDLMKARDDSAQIVIAYYYIALLEFVPEKYWWSQQRIKDLQGRIDPGCVKEALKYIDMLDGTNGRGTSLP